MKCILIKNLDKNKVIKKKYLKMKLRIKLTESDLHKIVKESVKQVLNERTKGELGLSDEEVKYKRDRNFADSLEDDYADSIYDDEQDKYKRQLLNRRMNHHRQTQNHR